MLNLIALLGKAAIIEMHRKGSEFRMTCHVFVCRDFVCIRQMEISGGSLYAASKAIVTALKPEQPGKVRSDRYCMYVCIISERASSVMFVFNRDFRYVYIYNQRASEASELSYVRVQSRFEIYALDVRQYAHARKIIAKKRP